MDQLVSSKLPNNLWLAKKLRNNSRYIDDIGVCNMNDKWFYDMLQDIYPDYSSYCRMYRKP